MAKAPAKTTKKKTFKKKERKMAKRQMKLGMSMRGLGYHVSAWRHPATPADGTLRFDHYVRNAQMAEQGLFDMIFFADGIGVREKDLPRGSQVPGHAEPGVRGTAAPGRRGHPAADLESRIVQQIV